MVQIFFIFFLDFTKLTHLTGHCDPKIADFTVAFERVGGLVHSYLKCNRAWAQREAHGPLIRNTLSDDVIESEF